MSIFFHPKENPLLTLLFFILMFPLFNSTFHPSNKISIFVLDHVDDLQICVFFLFCDQCGFELNQLEIEIYMKFKENY